MIVLFIRILKKKSGLFLEQRFCVVHKSNNKGKIEVEYYSNEELERLIDLLRNLEG